MADIVVYNLQDDGTPVSATGDQASVYTDATASSPAASGSGSPSKAAPSGSAASPITEGDVRNIVKSEMAQFKGDIRVGALLSGQVFILDPEGLRMGGTNFDTAPFSVTYDGHVTATSADITIATLGGFDIGSDYIRDTANTMGLASTVTGSNDVRGWAGAAFASRTSAPFRYYEDGSFFATDGTFSGTVRTSVFEKDVVSAIGGQLLVANADVLDTAMSALDSSTLTIKGETTFAVNDMLHLKDGTDEEYMRVTAIGSAPTYSVTRDLAAAYASNSNPAWAAGTAVVVEGSSDGASTYSGGFLKLLGSGTNSPKYSVFKRTGTSYNSVTEYATFGNLNGTLDYTSEEYGVAIGTTGASMSYDPTNGLRVDGTVTATSAAGSNLLRGAFLYTIDVDSNNMVFGCSSNIVNHRDYYVTHNDVSDTMKIYEMFGLNQISSTSLSSIWASATDLAGRSMIMDYGSTCHVFIILSDGSSTRIYFTLDPTATSPTWTQATLSGISSASTWGSLASDGTNVYVWDSASATQLIKLTWNGTTTLTYVSTITYGSGGDAATFTSSSTIYMTETAVYCITATLNKMYSLSGTYQKEVPGFVPNSSSSIKKAIINAKYGFYLPIFRGGTSSSTDYGLIHNLDGLY